MKITKIAFGSLALAAMLTSSVSLAHPAHKGGMWGGLSEDRFNEMKQMFQNNDYVSFKAQMEAKRAERQSEQAKFKDSITRTTENTDNGVVMTITSDDSDVVAKLQSREKNVPKNKNVERVQENLSNGVRITITSDDPEIVTRLQERKQGHNMRGRKGFKRFGMHGAQRMNKTLQ